MTLSVLARRSRALIADLQRSHSVCPEAVPQAADGDSAGSGRSTLASSAIVSCLSWAPNGDHVRVLDSRRPLTQSEGPSSHS